MGKLITILLIVFGLGLGFAGAYFAMPIIRPGYVEELRARLDSLNSPPDTTAIDSSNVAMPIGIAPISDADSIVALRQELASVKSEAKELADYNNRLAAHIDSVLGQRTAVAQLAATLSAMEDKDLEELVASLDESVLIAVYSESNRKNQARLLSKIPPDQAARLIRALFDERKKLQ
jgi:hypothetical protein